MILRDLFQTSAPDVAVEIDHTHVAAARAVVARQPGGDQRARQSKPLPAGLVVPGLAALNMSDVPALSQIIARTLGQLGGGKPSRVSLVIPDTVAKVSLLKLEKVPAKSADLREIVRWQMRRRRRSRSSRRSSAFRRAPAAPTARANSWSRSRARM